MISKKFVLVLALLSATAGLATDMYLSSMPLMRSEFGTDTVQIQLTLTTFLIGLALGQLIIGPLSDQLGRKKPVLIGMFLCLVSSLLCSLTTSIELLIICRFFQGFSGAAGIVIAKAIVTDSIDDRREVARLYQIMMTISTLAPVFAPTLGTFVSAYFGWRAVFVLFSIFSFISVAGTYFIIPETHPESKRSLGGTRVALSNIKKVITNKMYLSYALSMSTIMIGLFAYISGSSFVLQGVLGLTPTQYALVFGANAVAVASVGLISAKLVLRIEPKKLAIVGLNIFLLMSAILFFAFKYESSASVIVPLFFFTLAPLGLVFGNCSSLAISEVRELAGTGSAVLGALQFTMGALASPVVGLFGEDSGIPMVGTMIIAGCISLVFLTQFHKEKRA